VVNKCDRYFSKAGGFLEKDEILFARAPGCLDKQNFSLAHSNLSLAHANFSLEKPNFLLENQRLRFDNENRSLVNDLIRFN
jgi:hypothetical protein